VIGPKVNEARRPTRIVKLESTPGEILDSVMLGEGEGAEKATDQAVWRSLLAVAERHNLQARELRAVCDSVARCLVARAGLAPMRPDELPQEHLMAVPVELPRERVEEEAEMEAVV
jgi:hypothetical protein